MCYAVSACEDGQLQIFVWEFVQGSGMLIGIVHAELVGRWMKQAIHQVWLNIHHAPFRQLRYEPSALESHGNKASEIMIEQVGVQVQFNAVFLYIWVWVWAYEEGHEYAYRFPHIWQNISDLIFTIDMRLSQELVVKCLNIVVSYCQTFDIGRQLEVWSTLPRYVWHRCCSLLFSVYICTQPSGGCLPTVYLPPVQRTLSDSESRMWSWVKIRVREYICVSKPGGRICNVIPYIPRAHFPIQGGVRQCVFEGFWWKHWYPSGLEIKARHKQVIKLWNNDMKIFISSQ